MKKEVYTPIEIARNLDVDENVIYNLIHTNKLKACKIGRLYRILQEDLDAFLSSSEGMARSNKKQPVSRAPNQKKTPQFLTVSDTAKKLGISSSMVYELIRKKQLKAFRIASSWRVTQNDLDAYVSSSYNLSATETRRIPLDCVTLKEASIQLSISHTTVDQLIKENKLRCIREGRWIYIPQDAIDEYLQEVQRNATNM